MYATIHIYNILRFGCNLRFGEKYQAVILQNKMPKRIHEIFNKHLKIV